jgi:hypothetical protein
MTDTAGSDLGSLQTTSAASLLFSSVRIGPESANKQETLLQATRDRKTLSSSAPPI